MFWPIFFGIIVAISFAWDILALISFKMSPKKPEIWYFFRSLNFLSCLRILGKKQELKKLENSREKFLACYGLGTNVDASDTNLNPATFWWATMAIFIKFLIRFSFSHSHDPEGSLLDRLAKLSDVAGVVWVIGLIRVVLCVGAGQSSR